MDLIGALSAFVRVTETGSFSAVARETNASQSAVTRQVASLEQHFEVRLFHRTTRRLSLTDDGEALLGHARHLLESAEEMEASLGRQGGRRRGWCASASRWPVRGFLRPACRCWRRAIQGCGSNWSSATSSPT